MNTTDNLVIFASPRKNGNTAALLKAFLKKENITEYFLFDCFEHMPHPCIACGKCEKSFGCAFRDLDDFYTALENCRRIIIASPVYNSGFPAPLKALVDRLQIYYSARFSLGMKPPIKMHKSADILITSGSDTDNRETILPQILPSFTVINTELNRYIAINSTDSGDVSEQINNILK